jgi:hypothetical protein
MRRVTEGIDEDEEGRRVTGDGNNFTTTTTKIMISFYFSINIPTSHSIIILVDDSNKKMHLRYFQDVLALPITLIAFHSHYWHCR